MDIRAKGPLVELIQQDTATGKRFALLITRVDALKRAEAIRGMNENSPELQQALIRACAEAYKNETGLDYMSPSLKLMMATEKTGKRTGRVTW